MRHKNNNKREHSGALGKKKQEGKEERDVEESQEMISKRCRKENRGAKRKSEKIDV